MIAHDDPEAWTATNPKCVVPFSDMEKRVSVCVRFCSKRRSLPHNPIRRWKTSLAPRADAGRIPVMKLAQNQVWKQGDGFLRIVHLERLEVQYKAISNLLTGEGRHHRVSKKEFCRLIKGARLLSQEEVREIWQNSEPRA
jgi:hypothetical protein